MKWGKIVLLVILILCLFTAPVAAGTEGEPAAGIDWTPVVNAIVGLVSVLITTLIPMAIRALFASQTARLENLKTLTERNQEIVDSIVQVVQQTGSTLTNSEKYERALRKAEEQLHLPIGTLSDMIELAVSEAKLTWGEEWKKLGTKTHTEAIPTLRP